MLCDCALFVADITHIKTQIYKHLMNVKHYVAYNLKHFLAQSILLLRFTQIL